MRLPSRWIKTPKTSFLHGALSIFTIIAQRSPGRDGNITAE